MLNNEFKQRWELPIHPRDGSFTRDCSRDVLVAHGTNTSRGFTQAARMCAFHGWLIGRVRLGSIRNTNNWNNASKRSFGSYSYSGIPGFSFRLFCSQEQNSRNIFRNIPNELTLKWTKNICSNYWMRLSRIWRILQIKEGDIHRGRRSR